ncbi:MAG: RNA polymerase sigma factor (sigma-70 family) [Myxococcota bacterium]|jgi:RNA polymerase sigma factor (sigma-70 family)
MMTADVLAARAGDADAFTRLVQAHASTVCAIATAITGDPRAGEEVSQEVFVHAWTGLGGLRNPASFGGWLRQLTRNRACDAMRKVARRREAFDLGTLERLEDPVAEVGERLDGSREEQAVWDALDGLDGDHREVLVLFYREGRSVRQVASLLELQPATVRKRLSRARDHLRDDVQERLSDRLVATAPGAAFIATVSAALAAGAPATAHAATGGLAAAGLKGLLSGAFIGGTLGLAGVWLGYRQAARVTAGAQADRLRRLALAQASAVMGASLCFVLLPPLAGVLIGMPLLVAVLGGTVLSIRPVRAAGVAGLFIGTVCGLAGAAAGLGAAGVVDGWLAAALLVQLVCFISVPLAAGYAVSRQLDVPVRWALVGAVSWVAAAPFLAMGGPVASLLMGPTPLAGAIGLSVAAGLFEETARLGLYSAVNRWWGPLDGRRAVVLGIGHGGVEALLFGVGALAWLVSGGDLMDPASHALFGGSRLVLLLGHVGFTLLVWRAVRQRQAGWWAAAVGAHVLLDLAAFAGPLVWPAGGLAVAGGVVLLWGLISGGLVWQALRGHAALPPAGCEDTG